MMLKIAEVAERLKVSISLVYRLIANGDLPSYRVATAIRVREADLVSYLEANRQEVRRIPKSKGRHF